MAAATLKLESKLALMCLEVPESNSLETANSYSPTATAATNLKRTTLTTPGILPKRDSDGSKQGTGI